MLHDSNAGYVIAGAAIERITGQAWEAAVRLQVLEPLGMASAGFGPPTGANAWGHVASGDKLLAIDPVDPSSDLPRYLAPAGGIHCALADYAKFLRIFMTGGGGLLRPDTIEKMITPAVTAPLAYGLGWSVIEKAPQTGGKIIQHEGSNELWHAATIVSPDTGLAIVAVCNNDKPAGGPATQELAIALASSALKRKA